MATIVATLAAGPASADAVVVARASLPSARDVASAAWDGSNAYVFGGLGSAYLAEIVRYSPSSDNVTTMTATLPSARGYTSAVWDGTNAYVFGGYNGSALRDVVRFNPSTDKATLLGAALPRELYSASAIWDGSNAYIFGGLNGPNSLASAIYRFNSTTNTVTTMTAVLPNARCCTSAIWDGTYAYIFGGYDGPGAYSNQILRYSPSADNVTVLGATLPSGRNYASAVWDGKNAYIFGGYGGSCLDQVVRFVPSTGNVSTMSATFPSARYATSATWDGSRAEIFGGSDCSSALSQLARFLPAAPGPPQGVAVQAGPAGGQLTLRWQPPSSSTYADPITGYSVYRGTSSGAEALLASVGNVTSYTDSGMGDNATRYYRVTASNDGGEGAASAEAIGTTFRVPDPPSSPAATAGPGAGQLTVRWQAPSSDGGTPVTNYAVYRGASGGSEVLLARLGNVTGYTDSGLGNNVTRYYRITAASAVGEGAASAEVRATTFAPPGPPQNLTAGIGVEAVEVSWQPPSSNGGTAVTNYTILRATASGNESFLARVGNVTNYTDSGCILLTTCYYEVTATNLVGEGPQSNEANALGTQPGPTGARIVDGPYASVTPACPDPATGQPRLDVVCYRVGAVVEVASFLGTTDAGQVLDGTADLGALPLTLPVPVPTGTVRMGPDDDDDGLPAYVVLDAEQVTIGPDGAVRTAPADPILVPVDLLDGGGPCAKLCGPEGNVSLRLGCAPDAVCVHEDAFVEPLGVPLGEAWDAPVPAAPVLEALQGATGLRPVGLRPDEAVVDPAVDAHIMSPSETLGLPLEDVAVGPSDAEASCAGAEASVPEVATHGLIHGGVDGFSVPAPLPSAPCALLPQDPLVVPAGPVGTGL